MSDRYNGIESPDDIAPLPDFDAIARSADQWLDDPRNWTNERTVLEDIKRNTNFLRAERDREISRARALKSQQHPDRLEIATRIRWARGMTREIVSNVRGLRFLTECMNARREQAGNLHNATMRVAV